MPEEWKDIPNFPGYKVSNLGRVSGKRGLMKVFKSQKGYLRLTLRRDGVVICKSVHCLVMEAFIGPRPEKHEVCHIDHDKENNSLTNLSYGTSSENRMQSALSGMLNSKLSRESAGEIKAAYFQRGERVVDLAEKYGVNRYTIYDILTGRTWAYVE